MSKTEILNELVRFLPMSVSSELYVVKCNGVNLFETKTHTTASSVHINEGAQQWNRSDSSGDVTDLKFESSTRTLI